MENNQKLAELLFPDVRETVEDLERRFPSRSLPEGAKVTRFAPSPTGFLHIGGLFSAFVSVLAAKSSGGVCFLRIEDTDKKREVVDGVSGIIEGFRAFGIDFDEGVTGRRNTPDLHAVMQVLGKEKIAERIDRAMQIYGA